MYRVDRFRRFLKGSGLTGQGLVQFYGLRASRSYEIGTKAPAWVADAEEKMHTVDMGEVVRIK